MTIKSGQRLFVLDTNVLMHDPGALFRFQEHDIFLPMVVLEELDAAKKGLSELSRNVRQVSRFLDDIIGDADTDKISHGLKLSEVTHTNGGVEPDGCLFLQTQLMANQLPDSLPGKNADNSILATALSLQEKFSDKVVTLVSKDINLRIKARVLGIHTEDYYNDKVLDDADLLYTGVLKLPDDFWLKNADNLSSWQKNKNTYYKMASKPNTDCYPYQCLYTDDENKFEAIVESIHDSFTLRLATNYRAGHHIRSGASMHATWNRILH